MNTQELMELAELGNTAAMFNLGVTYSLGDGEKKNKPLAKFWYEKAASSGDLEAISIVNSMSTSDDLNRIAVNKKKLDAYLHYTTLGSYGFTDAIANYKEALEHSEELWSPTEKDLFLRRETYRHLGMLIYLNKGEDFLQTSEFYYEQGLPIEETQDIKTAAFYAVLMNKVYSLTGDKNYLKKCYDISEYMYHNRFNEINDNDIKYAFLQYIVGEKILGEIYPKDLGGASLLNETIKSLGENYIDDYLENCKNISGTYSVGKTTNTSSSHTPVKKKGLLGKIFR